jgi:hypothetical protein
MPVTRLIPVYEPAIWRSRRTLAWLSAAVIAVSGSDTGSGVESGSIAAAISGSDTGIGVENTSIAAEISGSDTGIGVENTSIAAEISGSDTGIGVENTSIAAVLAAADTGSGSENGIVTVLGDETAAIVFKADATIPIYKATPNFINFKATA